MKTPPPDRHIPDLVSLKEAGEILGVVRQYAHRLAESGQLRGRKVGGTWVFRRATVERLRDQRNKPLPHTKPDTPTAPSPGARHTAPE